MRTAVCRINGFTDLNLTKLDVLSDLDIIKLGVGYKGPDGALLRSMPANITDLEAVEVRPKKAAASWFGSEFGRAGQGPRRWDPAFRV